MQGYSSKLQTTFIAEDTTNHVIHAPQQSTHCKLGHFLALHKYSEIIFSTLMFAYSSQLVKCAPPVQICMDLPETTELGTFADEQYQTLNINARSLIVPTALEIS